MDHYTCILLTFGLWFILMASLGVCVYTSKVNDEQEEATDE